MKWEPRRKIAVIAMKEICSGISGSYEGYLYTEIILSSSSSGGDIKAEMVTGITEAIEDRKINLKEAVCIPFSADKFAEGTFIFLGHWITYSTERMIQVEERSILGTTAL